MATSTFPTPASPTIRNFSDLPEARSFATEDIIFSEGDAGECAYLVETGKVEISKQVCGRKLVLATLGPGELFGEMAPISGQNRSATAMALRDTEVIPISRDELQKKISESDPLVSLLLRVALNRLRKTQNQADFQDSFAELSKIAGPAALPHRNEMTGSSEVTGTFAIAQIKMAKALREAAERREFELYYQPVVRCIDGKVAGFEALLRWNREGELVAPLKFIPIAEQTGLIVPIGMLVLEDACDALKRFQKKAHQIMPNSWPLFMSVNVSARQLQNPNDVDDMVDAIRASGVDPRQIKLELTETLIVDNPETATAGFEKFKRLGVTLALDDFGTGYSSLSTLHQFRLDTLKVDRSFVFTMLEDENNLRIVRSIVGLAKELHMDVVAEGVEEAKALAQLRDLGCHYAQGYFISKPVPEEMALKCLNKKNL